jgi:hypothetical protein
MMMMMMMMMTCSGLLLVLSLHHNHIRLAALLGVDLQLQSQWLGAAHSHSQPQYNTLSNTHACNGLSFFCAIHVWRGLASSNSSVRNEVCGRVYGCTLVGNSSSCWHKSKHQQTPVNSHSTYNKLQNYNCICSPTMLGSADKKNLEWHMRVLQ